MNKKFLYVIFAIIIFFFIGLIIFNQSANQKEQTPGETEETSLSSEGVISQTTDEVDKLIREVIDTQNALLCQQIQNEETKKWCIKNAIIAEASVKRDAAVCEKLTIVPEKLECEDNVTITKALDAKDPNLCQNLNDKNRIEGCKEYINPK